MGDDINQAISKLTPVQRGMNLRKALSAERIQALQDAIISLARGDNVRTGPNILKKSGATWVSLTGAKGGGTPTQATITNCQFKPTLVANPESEGAQKLQIEWGIIANQQPSGFSAGGLPPYELDASAGKYYYAAASVDAATLLWNSAWIEESTDASKDNTSSTAYRLLFSVGHPEGDFTTLVISPYNCGPIAFDICELAPP